MPKEEEEEEDYSYELQKPIGADFHGVSEGRK
jgi:hypothetical protein